MKMVREIEKVCDVRLQRLEIFRLQRTVLQGGTWLKVFKIARLSEIKGEYI